MTRRDLVSLAGGMLCIALAVGLLLFARDVRAWPEAFREGDATFRAKPGGERPWESPDLLPFSPAERILDVDQDVTLRRGIRLYQLSSTVSTVGLGFPNAQRPIQPARRLLLRIERGDAEPKLRSRAANTLAVLTYGGSSFVDYSLIRQGTRLLREAILLDPANEEAKFNLELMMFTSPEESSQQRGGGGGGRAQPDAGGAGVTPPGRGY